MSCQEIDLHLIELKYARTRILDLESIFKMMRSLDRRVLASLARDNPKHAFVLAQFLAKKTCSTRELQDFFAAYQKAP